VIELNKSESVWWS